MKTLANVLAIVGFFMFIGTAGAGETGEIGLNQFFIQTIISMIMFIGGVWLGRYVC